MQEQPQQRGLRLTELLIVVAILGFVATISLPNLLNSHEPEKKPAVVALHPIDTAEGVQEQTVFVSGSTTDFDCDSLYTADSFVEWPEGLET